jgi:hypothetical protein
LINIVFSIVIMIVFLIFGIEIFKKVFFLIIIFIQSLFHENNSNSEYTLVNNFQSNNDTIEINKIELL